MLASKIAIGETVRNFRSNIISNVTFYGSDASAPLHPWIWELREGATKRGVVTNTVAGFSNKLAKLVNNVGKKSLCTLYNI